MEGWKFLLNAPKAHYFVDGKSLCKRWMFLGKELEPDNGKGSPDDCKSCRKYLQKRKEANAA